jgi:hypothetical protein
MPILSPDAGAVAAGVVVLVAVEGAALLLFVSVVAHAISKNADTTHIVKAILLVM